MKNILILFVSLLLIGVSKPALPQAGSITLGLIGTDCDQIIVEWTSTYSFVGAGNNQWVQATLTITWPETASTDGNTLGAITSLLPGFTGWGYDGAAVLSGGTEWQRKIILLSSGYTQDIPIGTTEVISIKIAGSGSGDFTIANPFGNTNISSFNFSGEMWSTLFSPATATGVTFADGVKWNGTRWCGGSSTTYFGEPSSADVLVNCNITGANGVLHESNAQVNNLTVDLGAALTIGVNASMTANKIITVNGANGLNIASDATGTGSFISKTGTGTGFTYGASGSSTVNQYFTDNVTSVPFHVHLVGPLVNDPAYQTTNGHLGVYLSDFDLVGGSTYAYAYDNTLVGSEWVNVSSDTYLVPATSGLALSTTTNTPQTLSMTGKFVHGNINTSNGGLVTNAGWNLISNPYPSGVNLENFLTSNSYDGTYTVEDVVYAWEGTNDAEGGNYSSYTYTAGGTGGLTDGKLRVGQGFFAEYTGAGNISFINNTHRVHANGILLKEEHVGLLRMKVSGNGFSDDIIVYFRENASNSFGVADAEKWESMYENATELWTVSEDNYNLTTNTMAPMGDQLVSVPMSFKCGADNDYTITASNMESFEAGTEIWLEDLKLGGDWHNLMTNPVYEFTGTPSDLQERFILHFFGPTGIDDDPLAEVSAVQIYGWGQDAYIVNRGSETIKEYIAYDMMGREIHRGSLPNSTVNKVQIGDVSAYYVVKVITKEGKIYTDKVYINK